MAPSPPELDRPTIPARFRIPSAFHVHTREGVALHAQFRFLNQVVGRVLGSTNDRRPLPPVITVARGLQCHIEVP